MYDLNMYARAIYIYRYIYIYIYSIHTYIFKEIKYICVLSNSFRRSLFQLHDLHKINTTKTYTL